MGGRARQAGQAHGQGKAGGQRWRPWQGKAGDSGKAMGMGMGMDRGKDGVAVDHGGQGPG
ncbi:MAG: hypothetical protein ACYDEQ_07635 [Desulfocucumaceae bacterium]